ncbi:MAG TPA: hypothetical protein V6C72_02335 [Chroococcales cyanobacterium]
MSEQGTSSYDHEQCLPNLVSAAVALAKAHNFEYSCLPGHGRLMQSIARGRKGAKIGETGTGCGVGTAWLVSGADSTSTIVSVEINEELAAAAGNLFRSQPNVKILCSSWEAIYDYGPFDILFLEAGAKNPEKAPDLSRLLNRGGTLILDDFSINNTWPRMSHKDHEQVDTKRMFWLKHPELLCTEIPTTEKMVAIVGIRI